MKFLPLLALLTFSQAASAADQAGYMRLFRGFKRADFTHSMFVQRLPAFMQSTLDLYGRVQNNYLVAVTPAIKPSLIADEMALLTYESEAEYKRIRATPEGERYAESHWEIFDKARSASVVVDFARAVPLTIEANKGYNFAVDHNDWSRGPTTFFIGLRKPEVRKELFLSRLASHVKLSRDSLLAYGLKGYAVVATEDYEIAVMNWESQAQMDRAFDSLFGHALVRDANEFMETLQWSNAQRFDGRHVEQNSFYSTLQR